LDFERAKWPPVQRRLYNLAVHAWTLATASFVRKMAFSALPSAKQ